MDMGFTALGGSGKSSDNSGPAEDSPARDEVGADSEAWMNRLTSMRFSLERHARAPVPGASLSSRSSNWVTMMMWAPGWRARMLRVAASPPTGRICTSMITQSGRRSSNAASASPIRSLVNLVQRRGEELLQLPAHGRMVINDQETHPARFTALRDCLGQAIAGIRSNTQEGIGGTPAWKHVAPTQGRTQALSGPDRTTRPLPSRH